MNTIKIIEEKLNNLHLYNMSDKTIKMNLCKEDFIESITLDDNFFLTKDGLFFKVLSIKKGIVEIEVLNQNEIKYNLKKLTKGTKWKRDI